MSAPEILVRLLIAVLCWGVGSAFLLPALGSRRGLASAGLLVVVGTVSVVVAARWGGDR